MRYAAIDIGTVTARLLVADVDEQGALHELYRRSEIVNLGAGVDETGMLAPDAINRVCSVVAQYRTAIDELSINEPVVVRCLATSASRDARNAGDFANRLAELGVELSVIPGYDVKEVTFKDDEDMTETQTDKLYTYFFKFIYIIILIFLVYVVINIIIWR